MPANGGSANQSSNAGYAEYAGVGAVAASTSAAASDAVLARTTLVLGQVELAAIDLHDPDALGRESRRSTSTASWGSRGAPQVKMSTAA